MRRKVVAQVVKASPSGNQRSFVSLQRAKPNQRSFIQFGQIVKNFDDSQNKQGSLTTWQWGGLVQWSSGSTHRRNSIYSKSKGGTDARSFRLEPNCALLRLTKLVESNNCEILHYSRKINARLKGFFTTVEEGELFCVLFFWLSGLC